MAFFCSMSVRWSVVFAPMLSCRLRLGCVDTAAIGTKKPYRPAYRTGGAAGVAHLCFDEAFPGLLRRGGYRQSGSSRWGSIHPEAAWQASFHCAYVCYSDFFRRRVSLRRILKIEDFPQVGRPVGDGIPSVLKRSAIPRIESPSRP